MCWSASSSFEVVLIRLYQQVLALWSGDILNGGTERGNGYVYLLDQSYTVVAGADLPGDFVTRTPGASYESNIDLYEVRLTAQGTVIVSLSRLRIFASQHRSGVIRMLSRIVESVWKVCL